MNTRTEHKKASFATEFCRTYGGNWGFDGTDLLIDIKNANARKAINCSGLLTRFTHKGEAVI